jgi:hypothetical protein
MKKKNSRTPNHSCTAFIVYYEANATNIISPIHPNLRKCSSLCSPYTCWFTQGPGLILPLPVPVSLLFMLDSLFSLKKGTAGSYETLKIYQTT